MEFIVCSECKKEISPEIPFCPYCGAKQKTLSESDYSKNPFAILQVSQEAEKEVIEAAYRSLAKKYHPDIDSSEHAQEKMQEINWAYGILKDEKKREEWKSRNTSTENQTNSEQKPQPQEKKIKSCPVCKNPFNSLYPECPYCKAQKEQEAQEKIKKVQKKRNRIIAVVAIIFLGIVGLPYIISGMPISNSSSVNKTNSFRATSIRKTNSSASLTKQARTKIASIHVAKPTNTRMPIVYAPPCIHWSKVSSQHVGAKQCVYGKIVKVMHNDYGNGFYEYVIRFSSSDDYFLVKSENYWWPDLKVGQCWRFEGVIQDNGSYFFMKKLSLEDVLAGEYMGCN